ncbi:MAG TPA: divalent-cation tolerance protein CutA [Vicinamibacterales bacterium]|nr:divalent-cation tolerance protein CutA [Vicinamibacterales bacterium]
MESKSAVCLVLTTWPAASPVEPFVRALVEARLAACVHVSEPGRSTYRWQGAVEEAVERQLVIKTTRQQVAAIEAHLHAAHPYDLPELVVCDAEGGRAYAEWIRENVAGAGPHTS